MARGRRAHLSETYAASDELQKVPELNSEIERRLESASTNLQIVKENAAKDAEAFAEKEAKRDDLKDRLEDLKLQRNKILLMSWLPSLTLRIGIVVLLLFLTQILLSTFRYLVALSGFYYGRADAVHLLQTKGDDSYSIIDLKELASITTPGELKIDAVKDPTEQLTGLLKAWLSGGAGMGSAAVPLLDRRGLAARPAHFEISSVLRTFDKVPI